MMRALWFSWRWRFMSCYSGNDNV